MKITIEFEPEDHEEDGRVNDELILALGLSAGGLLKLSQDLNKGPMRLHVGRIGNLLMAAGYGAINR